MPVDELPLVLVTGDTGFIATQIIKDLYDTGLYRVRGTTRNVESAKSESLKKLFSDIELVACTLTSDAGWAEAFKGVTFVLHLASPYLGFYGGNIEDFVKPAKEGTRRVLEGAMNEASVKRVVVTSSTTAIAHGHDDSSLEKKNFGPNDWTNLDNPLVTPYQRSKTIAEKLVWEFKKTNNPSFDICTMNPGMVFGPLLSKTACQAASSKQVKDSLIGAAPMIPRVRVPVVDIRDVSLCHVRSLEMNREVDGKRYILCGEVVWMVNLSEALDAEYHSLGYTPTLWELWYPVVWVGSFLSSALAQLLPGYGMEWYMDGTLAEKELLNCKYRDWKKAICLHADAIIKLGEVKKTEIYKTVRGGQ